LIFKLENLSKEQRCALWSISNVLLSTSLNDGLALNPMEFVTVKKCEEKFNKSSCIISENSGCVNALEGAFVVNPFDSEDIVLKIDHAINTSS